MPTNNGGTALLVITLQGAFGNADEAPIDGDQVVGEVDAAHVRVLHRQPDREWSRRVRHPGPRPDRGRRAARCRHPSDPLQPTPGVAGQVNTWTIVDGTPGQQVGIYASRRLGASILDVGACGGIPLGLRRPRLIGSGVVGPDGTLVIAARVGRGAAGKTYHFQAVEPASCRVSAVVSEVF
jgi:hypothetical protein